MSGLPEKAQQILDGDAPEKLRRGIAAGAIPMPPVDLVSCLAVMAAKEPDPELKQKAAQTLESLPENVRTTAIQANLAPPVFRVAYQYVKLEPGERKLLALNSSAPDDVIAKLARVESNQDVLEILAENQTRMLRHVELVEALLENTSLGPAMRARVEEFFSRSYAGKLMLQRGIATKEELADDDDWDDDLLDLVDEAAKNDTGDDDKDIEAYINEDENEVEDEEEASKLIEAAASEEKEGEEELDLSNLRKAVGKMAVPQKIKLALMGGKEARSLLVLDGNKVVSSMVLKNPRISEKEILAIAGSKSVREDMLRMISRDRKMMKSYSVKATLVENPKTPVAIAMQLLPQMRDNDLKRLAKSKGVSNNISTQARRMMMRKQNKNKKK